MSKLTLLPTLKKTRRLPVFTECPTRSDLTANNQQRENNVMHVDEFQEIARPSFEIVVIGFSEVASLIQACLIGTPDER
jgi:hypothetical protein